MINKRDIAVLALILLLIPIAYSFSGSGDGYDMTDGAVASGSATGSGDSYNIELTISGQPLGEGSGDSYTLSLGPSAAGSPPVINSIRNIPAIVMIGTQVMIQANVTDHDNDLEWVNFTLTAPNGTKVFEGEKGTNSSSLWNSTPYTIDAEGNWVADVAASDSENSIATGSFVFSAGITKSVYPRESRYTDKIIWMTDENTAYNLTFTIPVSGTHTLGVNASYGNGTDSKTVDVTVDNPPAVTLISPADNQTIKTTNISFRCNATSITGLLNISLYLTNNQSQDFKLNQTTAISGTSNSTEWILNLSYGSYIWNCLAYDASNRSGWGANRTLSVELNYLPNLTQPVITPDPAYTNDTLNCSTSYTDSNNDLGSMSFRWYNNSAIILNDSSYSISNGSTAYSLLGPGNFSSNNNIFCSARAYDGTAYSEWVNSSARTISALNVSLQCSVVNKTSCSGLDVLHMSGLTNAHAELYNGTAYDYAICCQDQSGNIALGRDPSGSNFLSLSNYTNSHVEKGYVNSYTWKAYLSSQEENISINCYYRETYGSCSQDEACLATISTNISGSDTDLHIADCVTSPYETSVCCALSNLPTVTLVSPPDSYASSSQDVTFTCNATDSNGLERIYLYTNITGSWGITNSTNVTGTSNATSFTVSNITEGSHIWNCLASDTEGNNASAFQNRTFIIDMTPPTITIDEPDSGEVLGWTIQLFTVINDTGAGTGSAWYEMINVSGIAVNTSVLANSSLYDYSGTWAAANDTYPDGNYTFKVYANDTVGNMASANVTFVLDNTKPSIQTYRPEASHHNSGFNMSVFVSNSHLNYTRYNITNSSGMLVQNNSAELSQQGFNWTDPVNASTLLEGNYTLAVYALDLAGNNRTVSTWFYIDRTPPNITAAGWVPPTPANSTISSIVSHTLNFTCSDDFLEDSWIDFNGTINSSLASTGNAYWWALTAGEGEYSYTGYCNDTAGNTVSTERRILTIDLASPVAGLVSPADGFAAAGISISLACNATDNFALENLTVYTNITGAWAVKNSTGMTGTYNETSFNLSNTADGSYIWNCIAYDVAGNYGWADQNRTFTVDTAPPSITITKPQSDDILRGAIDLLAVINDTGIGADFVWYEMINVSGIAVNTSVLANSSLYDYAGTWAAAGGTYPDGNYTFKVYANDTAGNMASANVTFVLDNTFPSVGLASPADGFNTSIPDLAFTCNASDSTALANITIYTNITGAWAVTNSTGMTGTSDETSFNISNIPGGTYIWNCMAYDLAGNYRWADQNRTFSIIVAQVTSLSVQDGPDSYDSTARDTHDSTPRLNWTEDEISGPLYTYVFVASAKSNLAAGNYIFTAYVNDTNVTVTSGMQHNGTNVTYHVQLIRSTGTFNSTPFNTTIILNNSIPAASSLNIAAAHNQTPILAWSVIDIDDGSDGHWPADSITNHIIAGNDSDLRAYYSSDSADNNSQLIAPAIPWGVPGPEWANRTVNVTIWATDGNYLGDAAANYTASFTLYDHLPDVVKVEMTDAGDPYSDCSAVGGCSIWPIENSTAQIAARINVTDLDGDCNSSTHSTSIYLCLNESASSLCSDTAYNYSFNVDSIERHTDNVCTFTFSVNRTNSTPQFYVPGGSYKFYVKADSQAGRRSADTEREGSWTYGTIMAVGYPSLVDLGGSDIAPGRWNDGTQPATLVNYGNVVLNLSWNMSDPLSSLGAWNLNGTDVQVDDDISTGQELSSYLPPVYLNATLKQFVYPGGLKMCVNTSCASNVNETLDTYFHIAPPLNITAGVYNSTIHIVLSPK